MRLLGFEKWRCGVHLFDVVLPLLCRATSFAKILLYNRKLLELGLAVVPAWPPLVELD